MKPAWKFFLACFVGGGVLDFLVQDTFLRLTGATPFWVMFTANGVWTIASGLALRRAVAKPCSTCGALLCIKRPGTEKCRQCDEHD